jgi:signal transduction histidine kinase
MTGLIEMNRARSASRDLIAVLPPRSGGWRNDRAAERFSEQQLATRRHIALELHDAIGHHLTVTTLLAAGSLQASEGELALRAALEVIEATSREALQSLREFLRADLSDALLLGETSLDQVATMVDRVRDAGLDVEFSVEGVPRQIGRRVEAAAFRVVQEALTNALRHAHGGTARVRLVYDDDFLRIRVATHGGVAAGVIKEDNSNRVGLRGLVSRVTAVGGRMSVTRDHDAFVIEAAFAIPMTTRRVTA